MGISEGFFYCPERIDNTLHDRISLMQAQTKCAIEERDTVLPFIKKELNKKLGLEVKHWIQGSYKSHTIIRPVRANEDFDLDTGIYLLGDSNDLSSENAKNSLNEILCRYLKQSKNAKRQESKPSCERIIFNGYFHIDFPIYKQDKRSGGYLLATDEGWKDSDPKAFQDWFYAEIDFYADSVKAKIRRVIRYLKAWNSLCIVPEVGRGIPSIAINILVVQNYVDAEGDDDSYIKTMRNVKEYLDTRSVVEHPLTGEDVLVAGADIERMRGKLSSLIQALDLIEKTDDLFEQYMVWDKLFKHLYPPYMESEEEILERTNLPAVTVQPLVRVVQSLKNGDVVLDRVTNTLIAYKGESLKFSLGNASDYSEWSSVFWSVKNQGEDAGLLNDLGHSTKYGRTQEVCEFCSYSGTHYMECSVIDRGALIGVGAVKVRIMPYARPVRNPPKRIHFKGF